MKSISQYITEFVNINNIKKINTADNDKLIVDKEIDSIVYDLVYPRVNKDSETILLLYYQHDNEIYKKLLNNLHKYSNNIPELLGDEKPEVVIKYLKDITIDEVNNIIYIYQRFIKQAKK